MSRGNLVRWGKDLVPRALVDHLRVDSACPECGGLGFYADMIDSEQPDVMVPCHRCKVYCRSCGRHVPKQGHQCPSTATKGT